MVMKAHFIAIYENSVQNTILIARATLISSREQPPQKTTRNLLSSSQATEQRKEVKQITKPLKWVAEAVVDGSHTPEIVLFMICGNNYTTGGGTWDPSNCISHLILR